MKQTEKGRRGRRDFTKALGAAVLTAPAALGVAGQTTTPSAPEAKAPPNPQPTPSPQQAPAPSPVAAAYLEVARARFGQQLTAEELARVARDLEGNVRAAERFRAHKLANADEPDFEFNV